MKVGASNNETNSEESSGYLEVGRFSEEAKYLHRALSGPKRKESVIYPTLRRDYETGEVKESFNAIVLMPKERTIIDKIAAVDKKIQEANGISYDDTRSQFSRNLRYVWIVISRDLTEKEDVPWIGPWEYPSRISKELTRFQRVRSTKDRYKLGYGPYYTFDVIIEKYYDKDMMRKTGGNKQFSTRYSIEVDPSCMPMAGKLPVELVENPTYAAEHMDQVMQLYSKVFTPAELNAINEYGVSLDDLVVPVRTDEEILEILKEQPINFNATDVVGKPLFKHCDELFEEIKNMGIRILEGSTMEHAPALPENTDTPFEEVEAPNFENTESVKEPAKKPIKEKPVKEKTNKPKEDIPEEEEIEGW